MSNKVQKKSFRVRILHSNLIMACKPDTKEK